MARRFSLNPDESAGENLARAVTVAVNFILATHRCYGLRGSTWVKDYYRDCIASTYRHFIIHKVRLGKYNREYPFIDNVISSAFCMCKNVAERYMRRMRYVPGETARIEIENTSSNPMETYIPKYLGRKGEKVMRTWKDVGTGRLAEYIRDRYASVCEDAEVMGVRPLSFEAFLVASGISKDERAMVALDGDLAFRKSYRAAMKRRLRPKRRRGRPCKKSTVPAT